MCRGVYTALSRKGIYETSDRSRVRNMRGAVIDKSSRTDTRGTDQTRAVSALTECPAIEITDQGVTIGEDATTVRLSHAEWNESSG